MQNEPRSLSLIERETQLAAPRWRMPEVARNMVVAGFRRRRLVLVAFFGVLAAALIVGLFFPRYEAEMKILVKHERVDPPVSPREQGPVVAGGITEEEVNSEVALLRSRDLLEKVVLETGLHQRHGLASRIFGEAPQQERVAKAVRRLEAGLEIEPIRKTNLIAARYVASDAQRAAEVLQSLARNYLEKHLTVHRPAGQFDFFEQQAREYQRQLQDTEAKLTEFTRLEGVVAPAVQRDLVVQQLNEFEAAYAQTQAAIAETKNRILALRRMADTSSDRLTTAVRTANNAELLQELNSTLLELELQRSELLAKYAPTYRPVREVEEKIALTRAALAKAEKNPLQDVTTDRDPTYDWVRNELAKAGSELKSLQARSSALQRNIADYRERARMLNEKGVAEQELVRNAKAQEENYLLYVRKREEARITDALDQRRIANVALAEEPTVPALPARSTFMYLLTGLFLATVLSAALVFAAEYLDPSVHGPTEVEGLLGIGVLATIPAGALHCALPSGQGAEGGDPDGNSREEQV